MSYCNVDTRLGYVDLSIKTKKEFSLFGTRANVREAQGTHLDPNTVTSDDNLSCLV